MKYKLSNKKLSFQKIENYETEELKKTLLGIKDRKNVYIDLSPVEKLSTGLIQIFASAAVNHKLAIKFSNSMKMELNDYGIRI